MPDIDPSSLTTSEPLQSLNPSTLTLSKPKDASSSAAAAQKASKADKDKGQQRIEIEPIYSSLKASIGEGWTEYKETIGLFVLGQLNQSELCLRIDHLLCGAPEIEHLHNSLIAALFANCHRDAPEPGVAPWVSANDKPASGISAGVPGKGGDKVEERLKREVMALPGRDRRRLKEVGERDPHDPNASYPITTMSDYRIARSIRLPDSFPTGAGSLNKTNWELEIRKRYTAPLSHETLEFPDALSVTNRMLPICYEESVPEGPAPQCAEFVATATEMYIKDLVTNMISITRSNFLLQHSSHRNVPNGARKSSLGNLGGRSISIGDMRFALGVSGCGIGSHPDIIAEVIGGWPEGVLEGWGGYDQEIDLDNGPSSTNHHSAPLTSTADSLMARGKRPQITVPQVNGVIAPPSSRDGPTVNGIPNGGGPDTQDAAALDTIDLSNGVQQVVEPYGLNNGFVAPKMWDEPAADGWAGSSSHDRAHLFDILDNCLDI